MKSFAVAVIGLALVCQPAGAESAADLPEVITGYPTITDGDSLRFGDVRVRLHGIDAPERKQKCRDGNRVAYHCGIRATDALAAMIRGKQVVCERMDVDRYGRVVGYCLTFTGGLDLGAAMVVQGWALAYRKYAMDYVELEVMARELRAGFWDGEFVKPWDWRRGDRLQ